MVIRAKKTEESDSLTKIVEEHKKGKIIQEIYDIAIRRAKTYQTRIQSCLTYHNKELPQELIEEAKQVQSDLEVEINHLLTQQHKESQFIKGHYRK